MTPRGLVLTAGTCALLLVPATRGGDKDAVQKAIDRGVACLKQLQRADGNWPYDRVGATALAGLALLECGVPARDAAVQKAAAAVRSSCIGLDDVYTTYSLSLAILFLDRLGDPADEPLIQAMGARLLAGQNPAGGWTYGCPRLPEEEARRLKALVEQQRVLVGGRQLPQPAPVADKRSPRLSREIEQMLLRIERQGPAPQEGLDNLFGGAGDNSNTQFAILGLWAAQRHGIPAARALALVDARFRRSQRADGGWAYMPALGDFPEYGVSTPAMTCAGLLGLAMGYGVVILRAQQRPGPPQGRAVPTRRDLARDPAVRAGLLALAGVLGQPAPGSPAGPDGKLLALDPDQPRDYYFLWSLERVAVAYDLTTIGSRDWYAWGSQVAVAVQRPDGSWKGKYGPDVDTSFALLFLRRANLTAELTAHFRRKLTDPGKAVPKTSERKRQPSAPR
jgi:hypothetical protein